MSLKSREYSLKRLYGITLEQYNKLLSKQHHKCGVCKRPAADFKTNLCVDHDHTTGHIRGLLCTFCNRRVIGRHKEAGLFLNAYEYLKGPFIGWRVPQKKKRKRRGKVSRTPKKRSKSK